LKINQIVVVNIDQEAQKYQSRQKSQFPKKCTNDPP